MSGISKDVVVHCAYCGKPINVTEKVEEMSRMKQKYPSVRFHPTYFSCPYCKCREVFLMP